jgi:hypothetical protein
MIRDIFVNVIINKKNKESGTEIELINLYKNINIPRETNVPEIFVSKAYYKKIGESMKIAERYPPKGPIPEDFFCSICYQEGPGYHAETCEGPFNMLFLKAEKQEKYEDKIEKFKKTLPKDQKADITHKNLFVPRGKTKMVSDKDYSPTFDNSLEIKFKTKSPEDTTQFSQIHPEGFIVVIRVNKYLDMTLTQVPYVMYIEIQKKIKSMIYRPEFPDPKLDENYTWISSISGIYYITEEKNKIIDLEKLNERKNILKGITRYKYSEEYSVIGFKFTIGDEDSKKVSVEIKIGGSVRIFVSYSKGYASSNLGNGSKITNRINDQDLIYVKNTLSDYLSGNDILKDKIIPRSAYFDTKIMNTFIPYTITENNKLKYNYLFTRNAPPQPETCRNSLPDTIQRPFPYSFKTGRSPYRNVVIQSEGKKSKSKFLQEKTEPCCEKLSGQIKCDNFNVKFQELNPCITPERLKQMKEIIPIEDTPIEKELDKYIAGLSGTRHKMFRRMIYGFPNDKFPDDSAEENNIKEGIEYIPTELYNNPTKTAQKDKEYEYIQKIQNDISCATYIPGTQIFNYGGNNTFTRDSRIYPGLLDVNKYTLLKFIEEYLENLEYIDDDQIKMIPIGEYYQSMIDTSKNKNTNTYKKYYTLPIKEKITSFNKEILKQNDLNDICFDKNQIIIEENNNIYHWYPNIDQEYILTTLTFKITLTKKRNNCIEIYFRDEKGQIKDVNEIISLGKLKTLVIPNSQWKKLKNEKIYKFEFNYYTEATGIKILIPQKPFILSDPLEIVEDYDKFTVYKLRCIKDPLTRVVLEE